MRRTCLPILVFSALVGGTVCWPASRALAEDGPVNLLTGAKVVRSRAVTRIERLTDGVAVPAGDFWLTDKTSRLRDPAAEVVWDLGHAASVKCVFVQGDNNDHYHLYGSINGDKFFPLWTAGPEPRAGMRDRVGKLVSAARYVRLHARGGDGLYGVSEVGVYRDCPATFSAGVLKREPGLQQVEGARAGVFYFLVVTIAFIAIHNRRNHRKTVWLAALPLVMAVASVRQLSDFYPLFDHHGEGPPFESLLRAVAAAITGALVYKQAFAGEGKAPDPRVRNGILAGCAVLSLGCYYHFGSAQFFSASHERRTLVHTWDLRHYAPQAKYFDELRFDGLYAAQYAAYLDLSGRSFDDSGQVRFRDLRNSWVRPAFEMRDHIEAVKGRFSEARWQGFKNDMKVFLDLMGPRDYLGGMNDHGGNATPVWMLGAHFLLRNVEFTETSLAAIGFIDPVLLALLFVAVFWAFGFEVMAYVVILFGATDFYMLGSNLMGSLLRQDWLVALGLGACAFKRGRPATGGALVAYAGLARAFPAMATFFLVAPFIWHVVDHRREKGGWPAPRAIVRAQAPAVRALVGAFMCVVVLFAASSAAFGVRGAWGTWKEKIAIHASDPSVNSVGLRNLMAFSPSTTAKAFTDEGVPDAWGHWHRSFIKTVENRKVAFYGVMVAFALAVLLALRRQPLERVVILALTTVPFFFYPSNYYMHLIFLLPIAAAAAVPIGTAGEGHARRALPWTVLVLCAVCVGQYFTLQETWEDLRFNQQSALLLAAFLAIVLPPAHEAWRVLFPPAPAPATPAAPTPEAATDDDKAATP